jgi:hypothetical protein
LPLLPALGHQNADRGGGNMLTSFDAFCNVAKVSLPADVLG